MKLRLALLMLLLPITFLGCGDPNIDAPPDNTAHPLSWIKDHPVQAVATANFADCTVCHANDLKGSDGAVSCYSCHAYSTGTNFTIHPDTWLTAYTSHRGAKDSAICANCHGSDLQGSPAAPSCFSASIEGIGSCHPNGPGITTHLPLDGSFLVGTTHGPIAKADLVVCQGCHAEAGGIGSNPRFNVGIESGNGTGCEFCHGTNLAHPANWLGNNSPSFHGTAGNREKACALCHGVNLDGIGGVGISCLSCHTTIPRN